MTEKGSRGSLKRARQVEEGGNSCSKLQVRDNNGLTAGDMPAAAATMMVPRPNVSNAEEGRNSPVAKECRIERKKWSRDNVKNTLPKKQLEEVTLTEQLERGRSSSFTKQHSDSYQISKNSFRNISLKETVTRSKSLKMHLEKQDSLENLTGSLRNTALSIEDISQTKKEQRHSRKESLKRKKSSDRRLAKQNSSNVSWKDYY